MLELLAEYHCQKIRRFLYFYFDLKIQLVCIIEKKNIAHIGLKMGHVSFTKSRGKNSQIRAENVCFSRTPADKKGQSGNHADLWGVSLKMLKKKKNKTCCWVFQRTIYHKVVNNSNMATSCYSSKCHGRCFHGHTAGNTHTQTHTHTDTQELIKTYRESQRHRDTNKESKGDRSRDTHQNTGRQSVWFSVWICV